MKAKSIKGNSAGEIESALQQSLTDGFRPTLALVFVSIKQDRKAICEILHTEGIDIIGATSCGEFIDGYQGEGSVVILLLDLQRDAYTILFENIDESSIENAAARIAQAALKKFTRPGFILCSTGISVKGEYLNGEILINKIEDVVGPQVNIFGGMAGDDYTVSGTWVFTYEQSGDNAIAALVLDEDKVSLQGMAISGWKPLGISRTVTKSEGGWIYTIDDQPAVDMYMKYLGLDPTRSTDKYQIFEGVGVHYPFQVERPKGEPVLRTPMAVDRNKNALMCDFDIPQGTKLRFSMPPDFDIVETVINKASELKNTTNTEAEALLIFSCAGRLSALGPMANAENEGLHDVWKAPMAGFFTYGEFGKAINGKQEFHSTTCCWVALKEK